MSDTPTVVPAGDRRRLGAIKNQLQQLKSQAARALYALGALFSEVYRGELWRIDGSTSFTAWVEEETGYSDETARKAMTIAEHFNAEMAARHGSEKLAATVRYLDATRRVERPGDVLAIAFRLRDDDGRYFTVPFVDATYRQINAATRLLTEARREPTPEDDRARASRLADALPPPPAGVRRTGRVKLARGRDGRLAVSFQGIPVDELDAFIAALKEHPLTG